MIKPNLLRNREGKPRVFFRIEIAGLPTETIRLFVFFKKELKFLNQGGTMKKTLFVGPVLVAILFVVFLLAEVCPSSAQEPFFEDFEIMNYMSKE